MIAIFPSLPSRFRGHSQTVLAPAGRLPFDFPHLDIPEVDVRGVERVDDAEHRVHGHRADGLAVLAHHLGRQARVNRLDKHLPGVANRKMEGQAVDRKTERQAGR